MPKFIWVLAAAGLLVGCLSSEVWAAASTTPRSGTSYTMDVWTIDEGLPMNTVTSIIQTRDGYLWFGTLNGLVRFDGMRFTVFDESNTPGLDSSKIVKLFEDREGNVWAGTESAGVVLVKNGQVKSQGIGKGAFDKRLESICQDTNGAVWLYTANGELWRYWKEKYNVFRFGLGRRSVCRSVIAELSGRVWVGADWHQAAIGPKLDTGSLDLPVEQDMPVNRLDFLLASQQGGFWRLADRHIQKFGTNGVVRDLGSYPWSGVDVTAACEDRQGNLVVGTRGRGAFWYGADGVYSRLSAPRDLRSDVVLSLCTDREGCLWVGTDGGGLCRVKSQVFEVLDVSQGPVDRAVQSICEDGEGGLWIGSLGSGASWLKDGVTNRYGPSQGLANINVMAVFVDRSQKVWAGTWGVGFGGLFQKRDGQFQRVPGPDAIHRPLHAIHEDRSGRLWVGTRGGVACLEGENWKVFTTLDGLSANEVQALADDPEENLWIGTVGGGLNRLQRGVFTSYHKQDGVPSEDISSLYVDRDEVLWIGTSGGGLGRYHQGKWTRYTTREGLLSNNIGYMVEDDKGFLWMGSYQGLMRVNKQDLNDYARHLISLIPCRAYGKPDGLPTRECTSGSQPGAWHGRNGKLWFATAKGTVSVDPGQIGSNTNTNPPPVVIESVWIDGQLQNTNALLTELSEPVIIRPGNERVEIRYTSLNLAAPDKARFKCWLEGHEKGWVEAGNVHVAWYSTLPPGNYRFHVKASNEDGVWNEQGCSLALIVETPFWKTWWFLGMSAVIALGSIVALVHYFSTQKLQRQLEKLKHQESLDKERSRIAQDIHDQLGASLTQVSMLGDMLESDKDHPEEVEAHARQISQTARETTRTLDEIVWAVNPSNDTLEGLMTYLCKYAQEYLSVAGLKYRLDMPDQLPQIVIPPEFRHHVYLTLKEALTNVVRHAGASSVWIRLRLEPSTFILEIQDNGRGVANIDEKAARLRNGLSNMRKRMEAVGGSFSLNPAPEGGALARLTAALKSE